MNFMGRNHRNRRIAGEDTITLTNDVQPVREGDFVSEEDGLLYCGTCGRPKQVRITENGIPKVQNCRCGCEEEETPADRQENLEPGALRRYPLCTFRHIGRGDRHPNLECFTTYVERWEDVRRTGANLCITGKAGSGKTFYAACTGNALKAAGVDVTMVPVSELTQVMRALDGDRQSRMRRGLEQAELLILDDLWMESLDGWDTEFLLALLGLREQNRRPTIVTSRQDLMHYVPDGPGAARRGQLAERLGGYANVFMDRGEKKIAQWESERMHVQTELMLIHMHCQTRDAEKIIKKYGGSRKEEEDAG